MRLVRFASGGLSERFSGAADHAMKLANAYAGVEAGVDVLDASVGGIGGCPFASGATAVT